MTLIAKEGNRSKKALLTFKRKVLTVDIINIIIN